MLYVFDIAVSLHVLCFIVHLKSSQSNRLHYQ